MRWLPTLAHYLHGYNGVVRKAYTKIIIQPFKLWVVNKVAVDLRFIFLNIITVNHFLGKTAANGIFNILFNIEVFKCRGYIIVKQLRITSRYSPERYNELNWFFNQDFVLVGSLIFLRNFSATSRNAICTVWSNCWSLMCNASLPKNLDNHNGQGWQQRQTKRAIWMCLFSCQWCEVKAWLPSFNNWSQP